MTVKTLTMCLSALMLILIIELVRRERLTFKYAAGWIFISLTGISLAAFDRLLLGLSRFLGFELLSNFVFFTLLGIFVFLSLILTILLCQQNSRNDRMAQKIGLLEQRVEGMENRKT